MRISKSFKILKLEWSLSSYREQPRFLLQLGLALTIYRVASLSSALSFDFPYLFLNKNCFTCFVLTACCRYEWGMGWWSRGGKVAGRDSEQRRVAEVVRPCLLLFHTAALFGCSYCCCCCRCCCCRCCCCRCCCCCCRCCCLVGNFIQFRYEYFAPQAIGWQQLARWKGGQAGGVGVGKPTVWHR